jgi:hypothetical protein
MSLSFRGYEYICRPGTYFGCECKIDPNTNVVSGRLIYEWLHFQSNQSQQESFPTQRVEDEFESIEKKKKKSNNRVTKTNNSSDHSLDMLMPTLQVDDHHLIKIIDLYSLRNGKYIGNLKIISSKSDWTMFIEGKNDYDKHFCFLMPMSHQQKDLSFLHLPSSSSSKNIIYEPFSFIKLNRIESDDYEIRDETSIANKSKGMWENCSHYFKNHVFWIFMGTGGGGGENQTQTKEEEEGGEVNEEMKLKPYSHLYSYYKPTTGPDDFFTNTQISYDNRTIPIEGMELKSKIKNFVNIILSNHSKYKNYVFKYFNNQEYLFPNCFTTQDGGNDGQGSFYRVNVFVGHKSAWRLKRDYQLRLSFWHFPNRKLNQIHMYNFEWDPYSGHSSNDGYNMGLYLASMLPSMIVPAFQILPKVF